MALTSEIRSRTWQKWIRPAAIVETACQDVGGLASPETPHAVLVRTAPDPPRDRRRRAVACLPGRDLLGGAGRRRGRSRCVPSVLLTWVLARSWPLRSGTSSLRHLVLPPIVICEQSTDRILDQSEIAIVTYFGVDCYLFSRNRTRAFDSALDICHHSSAVFTSFTGFSQGPPVTILSPMSPPSSPRACRLSVRERGARLASRSAPPT